MGTPIWDPVTLPSPAVDIGDGLQSLPLNLVQQRGENTPSLPEFITEGTEMCGLWVWEHTGATPPYAWHPHHLRTKCIWLPQKTSRMRRS